MEQVDLCRLGMSVHVASKQADFVLAPTQCADTILGGLDQYSRRIVICRGQLDSADLVLAGARVTGPAHATVSAWEVDEDDVIVLGTAVADGRLLSCKMLTEPGVKKDGATWDKARRAFGEEGVSFSATHAKVVTLENDRWSLFMRGSLNMRKQLVLEQFEVEHSPDLCSLWRTYAGNPQVKARYPKAGASALGSDALANIERTGRAFGLTQGYSAIDLLRAALTRCGASEVRAIGFKMGPDEAAILRDVLANESATSVHVVLSPAFVVQNPQEAHDVEETLGASNVKLGWSHGRWFTVRGPRGTITIHSSANLNRNPRCEQWDATTDVTVADFFDGVHAQFWERTPEGLTTPRPEITSIYKTILMSQNGLVRPPPNPPPFELPSQTELASMPYLTDQPIDLRAYAADSPAF